jgi:hypothetical protein
VRGFISGLLTVCCAFALIGCSHTPSRDNPSTVTAGAAAPTPATTVTTAPSVAPTPSAAPTATTPLLTGAAVRPGEVPPTISSYVDHDTAAGALAFAAYYYKALDWSIATTNPNLLRNISATTCTACQSFIQGLDALAATGGYSQGGRGYVTQFVIVKDTFVNADYTVKVTVRQENETIVNPGAAPTTYPYGSKPAINYLYMDWKGSRWQAVQITRP